MKERLKAREGQLESIPRFQIEVFCGEKERERDWIKPEHVS